MRQALAELRLQQEELAQDEARLRVKKRAVDRRNEQGNEAMARQQEEAKQDEHQLQAKKRAIEKRAEAAKQAQKDAVTQQKKLALSKAKLEQKQAKLMCTPRYWGGSLGASRTVDVTASMKNSIEWLMQKTAQPQHHGKGRDSHGQTFRKFRVKRVQRIENPQLHLAYQRAREAIAAAGSSSAIQPPVETAVFKSADGARLDRRGANERELYRLLLLLFAACVPASACWLG